MNNYKFIYRKLEEGSEHESSDEESAVLKIEGYDYAGYLEKRGKRHRAWRERWFVLKGDSLYYFKSDKHPNHIACIHVNDAAIRESPRAHARCRDFRFEVNTKQRVFYLKAQSYQYMCRWITELKKQTHLDQENFVIDEIETMIQQIELEKSNIKSQVMKEISSLEGTLKNPVALDRFRKFVEDSHSEENLLFWQDAENYYVTDRTPVALKKCGLDIFNKFVAKRADFAIAVSGENRKQISAMIEAGDTKREAFRQLQAKCLSHMSTESFPKFINSDHYQKALLNMPMSPIMNVPIALK